MDSYAVLSYKTVESFIKSQGRKKVIWWTDFEIVSIEQQFEPICVIEHHLRFKHDFSSWMIFSYVHRILNAKYVVSEHVI